MAPKITPNPAKVDLCVQWIRNSGTTHTLKDLEKSLPSAASISNMQVKEYVQSMTDENHIRVEKIGSGNWYWSFQSDLRVAKEQSLSRAQEEHDKAAAIAEDLRRRIKTETATRVDDEEMLLDGGANRETLVELQVEIRKDLDRFNSELDAYKDNDPEEWERRKAVIKQNKLESTKYTEQILAMEQWIKNQSGGDKESLQTLRTNTYGQELDLEEGLLKEI